ncbi:unnamed protein product [Onchocerca flexuosa]|uniref:Bestrophin homolog n=1 Tax=Onchocerca flexuosa TaxID=387005 RepID=A0A183I7H0_9BILA|nr:unnamed protein product [Onchocerca flexuosa]
MQFCHSSGVHILDPIWNVIRFLLLPGIKTVEAVKVMKQLKLRMPIVAQMHHQFILE